MKCQFCTKDITKYQYADRVEVHVVFNDARGNEYKVYGNAPGADGLLTDARGPLSMVFHSKCWLVHRRRQQLQQARDADPSAQHVQTADWREPVSAEVEDIRPREGDRDNRGTGTPGR